MSRTLAVVVAFAALFGVRAGAQQAQLVNCKPAAERTQPEGCWIVASELLGKLGSEPVFWTLDRYPTPEIATAAAGHNSAVVQALGKTWVFTVGDVPQLPPQGQRVTRIGPLPVKADDEYTAQFMEGILQPGAVSRTHTHSGPEAFYTEAGESCLETPAGKQVGRTGVDIIVPEGVPMELVASGTQARRGIILVLHSSSKPPTSLATTWKSKGLCLAPAAPTP